MNNIQFDSSKISKFVSKEEIDALYPEALEGLKRLKDGTSKGNDFLGWLNLPADITPELLADIEKTAADLRSRTRVVVVIGIGGSYLGARVCRRPRLHSRHYKGAEATVKNIPKSVILNISDVRK